VTAPVKVNGHARIDLVKIAEPRPVTTETPVEAVPRQRLRRTRRVFTVSRAVVTDDRTRTVCRAVARHGLYAAGGTRIVWRRAWDSRTPARYERMIRTAEAAGNSELAQEWEERANRFRTERHRRRMDMLKSPEQLALSVRNGSAVFVGAMLALGIFLAVAEEDAGQVLAPWKAFADAVRLLAAIAAVVWGLRVLLLAAAVCASLLALWSVGRQQQTAPAWALPPAQRRGDDEPITPHKVVLALRHLGIAPLKKAILSMEDGGGAMLSPIVLAGCGVELDVSLPLEVSTKEVLARRRKLAENLGRHEHEVYLSVAPAARTVRMWIADSGALDEPAGPSPLVTDPDIRADYKTGRAPWGPDLRGDAATISLYQRMLLITGASNQGKTASLRTLALWLAFDPTVELWIGDLKGIGDWRMFLGIATVLIEGPTDEHVARVTETVERAVAEMERRLQAPPGTKWDPLIVIVDEAQMAFMCPAKDEFGKPYGGKKNTSRYYMACRKLHNQGRVVDVLLWQGTQDPTDENLPKLVRNGAHIRASLALGSEAQSEMALGDQAAAGGAAPHLLRQGLDKGRLVVAGDLGGLLKPGQASITISTHFVDTDPAHEVAERIRQRRNPVATSTAASSPPEPRDHLSDLRDVLGAEERVRTTEVIHRLKTLDHAAYRDWDGARLKRELIEAGEDTDKYTGYPVIKRQRVLDALARRDQDATDD